MWLKIHVDNIVRPLVRSKDLLYYKLLKDWNLIVGTSLSGKVFPHNVKVSKDNFNVLTVTIDNHCNVLEVQMMIPKIIERITTYLGTRYISKIKIVGLKNKNIEKKKDETSLFLKDPFNRDEGVISSINNNKNEEIKDILLRIAKNLS